MTRRARSWWLAAACFCAAVLLRPWPAVALAPGERLQIIVASSSEPVLNKSNLDLIKRFILDKRERCSVPPFESSPCWALADFKLYLQPDPGPDGDPRWNLRGDPARGDFNILVIEGKQGPASQRRIEFLRENEIRVTAPHPTEGLTVDGLRALPEAVVLEMLAVIQPPRRAR